MGGAKLPCKETRVPKHFFAAAALLVSVVGLAGAAGAAEQQRTCPMGREYYLYAPDDLDKARTYWLVVGVHGAKGNGKGAARMAAWVKKGNVIVVGPSFPDGYQGLMHDTDKQLQGIFAALQKEFRLHPKLFLYGFSGGSQFAHRFAMKYPEQVIGCSAHSGGSWTDGINAKAAAVPFAISCGEADTAKSTPMSPMVRLEWCRKFAGKLQADDFYFKVRFWPGVGHGASRGSAAMTEDCFVLSTTGMHEDERQKVQAGIDAIKPLVDGGRFAEALEQIKELAPPRTAVPPRPGPARPGPTRPAPTKARAEEPKPAPAEPQPEPPKDAAAKPAVADEGTRLAGLQENAYGWHENAPGTPALAEMRRFYIEEQTQVLAAQIEKAALEKIAAIESAPPADAAVQLDALARTFAAQRTVMAAIGKARAKVARPPAAK